MGARRESVRRRNIEGGERPKTKHLTPLTPGCRLPTAAPHSSVVAIKRRRQCLLNATYMTGPFRCVILWKINGPQVIYRSIYLTDKNSEME